MFKEIWLRNTRLAGLVYVVRLMHVNTQCIRHKQVGILLDATERNPYL